ncbi:MAG: hypothetical protein AAFZ07_15365 [Actinomycetota bacterium]
MSPVRRLLAVTALAVVTAACASGATGDEADPAPEPTTSVAETTPVTGEGTPATEVTEVPSTSAPDGADLTEQDSGAEDRLLIAAVIVATGALDEALEAGVVTPAEVEAAIVAVETGALSAVLES